MTPLKHTRQISFADFVPTQLQFDSQYPRVWLAAGHSNHNSSNGIASHIFSRLQYLSNRFFDSRHIHYRARACPTGDLMANADDINRPVVFDLRNKTTNLCSTNIQRRNQATPHGRGCLPPFSHDTVISTSVTHHARQQPVHSANVRHLGFLGEGDPA